MARLIIVRHAESALNLQNRIQGHMDSSLTAKGLRQARRLAARLKHFHIDKIYSSDLGRAYSTTVEITKHIRKPIVKDTLLREINLGCWEGMTPNEVDEKFAGSYQRWLRKPSSCRIPEGEKIEKFRKRITGRIRQIALQNKGQDVLVVTHGGAITALLADWLDADFDDILLHLQIDNTSLTIVDYTKKRYIVRAINDTAHLTSKDRLDRLFTKKI